MSFLQESKRGRGIYREGGEERGRRGRGRGRGKGRQKRRGNRGKETKRGGLFLGAMVCSQ